MNIYLKGNGLWCRRCKGSGRGKAADVIFYSGGGSCQFYDPCPDCKGIGRLAAAVDDVIAGRVPPTTRAHHTLLSQLIEYA